jgi:hypothetical protein
MYNVGYGVFAAFCIISAIDVLDDASGLLDWEFAGPVSMGSPTHTALQNVGAIVMLWCVGRAGMAYSWWLKNHTVVVQIDGESEQHLST